MSSKFLLERAVVPAPFVRDYSREAEILVKSLLRGQELCDHHALQQPMTNVTMNEWGFDPRNVEGRPVVDVLIRRRRHQLSTLAR